MYDHKLKACDCYYAKAQAITTSQVAGNDGSVFTGNAEGALGVIIKAKTETTVIEDKVLTVVLEDSADDSSFATFKTLVAETGATGNTVYAAGEQIGDMFIIPPAANPYTQITLGADSATAGTLDIYLVYLPR